MRQFVCSQSPDKKGQIPITGKDFKYLAQVLRLKENDMIDVRLPSGSLASMIVVAIQKKEIISSYTLLSSYLSKISPIVRIAFLSVALRVLFFSLPNLSSLRKSAPSISSFSNSPLAISNYFALCFTTFGC